MLFRSNMERGAVSKPEVQSAPAECYVNMEHGACSVLQDQGAAGTTVATVEVEVEPRYEDVNVSST